MTSRCLPSAQKCRRPHTRWLRVAQLGIPFYRWANGVAKRRDLPSVVQLVNGKAGNKPQVLRDTNSMLVPIVATPNGGSVLEPWPPLQGQGLLLLAPSHPTAASTRNRLAFLLIK